MAEKAKKPWPWPGLPGFTRPHFPGKLGQKPGKPGLARLCQAGRVGCRKNSRDDLCVRNSAGISIDVQYIRNCDCAMCLFLDLKHKDGNLFKVTENSKVYKETLFSTVCYTL